MSVSVRDALGLECFKGVKVIAGASGLDRIINRVSVLESPDLDDFSTIMGNGDFIYPVFMRLRTTQKPR